MPEEEVNNNTEKILQALLRRYTTKIRSIKSVKVDRIKETKNG